MKKSDKWINICDAYSDFKVEKIEEEKSLTKGNFNSYEDALRFLNIISNKTGGVFNLCGKKDDKWNFIYGILK